MPDRAIIPLLPALALGFICGIIASALLLGSGATLMVGIAGAVLTALTAYSSVFGVRGPEGEKAIVGVLRAGLAIGLFVAIYLFILGFLRDGSIAAVIWIPFAVVFGLLLARLRVRDRGDDAEQGSSQQTATS